MLLFVLYAVLVWYACARWRRRWLGFACALVGAAGVVGVAIFHIHLNRWSGGRIYLPVLQSLLYPYGVLLLVMGLYIACLPRSRPAISCRRCHYDLAGLEEDEPRCPECGLVAADPRKRHARGSRAKREVKSPEVQRRSSR